MVVSPSCALDGGLGTTVWMVVSWVGVSGKCSRGAGDGGSGGGAVEMKTVGEKTIERVARPS